jgi:hypothetical protein
MPKIIITVNDEISSRKTFSKRFIETLLANIKKRKFLFGGVRMLWAFTGKFSFHL